MKISLRPDFIPGLSPADMAKWAKDHGAQAIEIVSAPLDKLKKLADQITPSLPISSVCGNCTVDGQRGFNFLSPDIAERRASIDGSKAILGFCGEVGAVGQIVPPIFGPPVIGDLSPFMDPIELEDALMAEQLKELAACAHENNTLFMLEPLNRYEQHYLRKQSDAIRLIEKAGRPKGAGLLSDFFHMHIEETNTPQTFREVGQHTSHIHMADNTRLEPGTGDIDFVAAFKALNEVGFDGYLAWECGISGDDAKAKENALAKSIEYIQDCLAKAK